VEIHAKKLSIDGSIITKTFENVAAKTGSKSALGKQNILEARLSIL
jgi:hypothetical protein